MLIARGNNGDPLFHDDGDREAYLSLLRDLSREELFRLYAYCLEGSEVRLCIEPTRLNLAQSIQRLHGSHARRINERAHRRGHLFEGRFFSVIIPRTRVPDAVRWIHLRPVHKGHVRRAELYPWSSHRAYVAHGDEWGDVVDAWEVLGEFGDTLPVAQRGFSRFVERAALDPDAFDLTEVFPGIAGDRAFAEDVLAEAGVIWRGRRRPALKTLARRVSLLMNVSTDEMRSPSRLQTLVLARRLLATCAVREASRSVTEVADFLDRDKAQVSRLVAQGMELMRTDEAFRILVQQVRGRAGRETPARA